MPTDLPPICSKNTPAPATPHARKARRHVALPLTLAAALLLGAIPSLPLRAARADDGMTTVTLTTGAIYRGELVELVPGDHVTIKLATGEVKRFEARELSGPPQTSSPATPLPAPVVPAPSPSPERAPEAEGPTSRVHIDGDDFVLERETNTGTFTSGLSTSALSVSTWERVCRAPCDVTVPTVTRFRLTGEGRRASDIFELREPTARIEGRLGSSAEHTGGKVFLWGGVAFLALGAAFYWAGSASDTSTAGDMSRFAASRQQQSSDVQTYGEVGMVIGGAVLILGVVLLADSSNSVVVNGRAVAAGTVPLGGGIALTPRGLVF